MGSGPRKEPQRTMACDEASRERTDAVSRASSSEARKRSGRMGGAVAAKMICASLREVAKWFEA